jgi:hypothetical protein
VGWEIQGRRRYYTRTRKVQGRYVRTYVGGGQVGEMAAAADALRRANRQAAAAARRADHERYEAAAAPMRRLKLVCGLLLHAALTAAGYYKHGGEWRRSMTTTTSATTPASGAAGDGPDDARLQQILQRAMEGDRRVLPELAKVLDDQPSIWQTCGDLAAQAQASWINLAAGSDLLMAESLRRKQEAMRAELAGSDASPLEKLLVDRVVACWLQVNYADALSAQAKGTSLVQDAALQKRQNLAQARYLAAVKALAQVRKLLKPSPSPLDLLRVTVPEKTSGPAASRRFGRREVQEAAACG